MIRYVYCPSYPSLALVAYFTSQHEAVCVVSPNEDVCKAARDLGIPILRLDYAKLTPPRIRHFLMPQKWLQYRKALRQFSQDMSERIEPGSAFYFTITCIDLIGLHLIDSLIRNRKDVEFHFWNETPGESLSDIRPACFASPRNLINLLYVNYYYKPFFYHGMYSGGMYFFASDGFLKRSNVKTLTLTDLPDANPYNSIGDKIANEYAGDVIFIGNYSLDFESEWFDREDLLSMFKVLKHHCADIVYKPHPGPSVVDSPFGTWRVAPKHIPSEILCRKARLVIGTATTAMNALAKGGVTCISLAYLLKSCQGFDKEFWVSKMKHESNENIIFVRTPQELSQYLDGVYASNPS